MPCCRCYSEFNVLVSWSRIGMPLILSLVKTFLLFQNCNAIGTIRWSGTNGVNNLLLSTLVVLLLLLPTAAFANPFWWKKLPLLLLMRVCDGVGKKPNEVRLHVLLTAALCSLLCLLRLTIPPAVPVLLALLFLLVTLLLLSICSSCGAYGEGDWGDKVWTALSSALLLFCVAPDIFTNMPSRVSSSSSLSLSSYKRKEVQPMSISIKCACGEGECELDYISSLCSLLPSW